MSKLFLHIGHGKTGTSYLQSVFARNVPQLAKYGIDYLGPEPMLQAAASGVTSSGNGALFLKSVRDNPDFFATERSQLFSGETLWTELSEPDFTAKLAQITQRYTRAVKVLFFIRDPVDFLLSHYLQSAQQAAEVQEMNQFATKVGGPRLSKHLERVLDVQKQCQRHGFELTVVNYSHRQKHLLEYAKTFMDLPDEAELEEPAKTVNRSIGAFELGLKRGLAGAFDGMALPGNKNYIRRLVDATPGLEMPPPVLSDDAYKAFGQAIKPVMDRVNAYLPKDAQYRLEYKRPIQVDTPFTEDYGDRLAREVVRATLVVLTQNLDDAGREALLGYLVKNDLDVDLQILRQYSELLVRRNAHAEAVSVFEKIIEIKPSAGAFFQLVMCYMALKDMDRAMAVSKTLFEFDPSHERNVLILVDLLVRNQGIDAAYTAIKRAQDHGLAEAKQHFLQYKIEAQAGNYDTARKALRLAVAIEPENAHYQDLLAKM